MVTTFNPPANVPAALAQGRQLLESNPAQAAARARQVLASTPHNADAYRLLGSALRRLGEHAAANEAELAAIEESGNDPELIAAGGGAGARRYRSPEQNPGQMVPPRPADVAPLRLI